MAIKYRMYQSNRKNSKTKGKWYARAVVNNQVRIKDLAERISEKCTVTEADILAVISALVREMSYELKNGSRVTLEGFGSFKVGIHSQGVTDLKEFVAAKHIYNPHVIFQPETHVGADKMRVKQLISGVKVSELEVYSTTGDQKGSGAEEESGQP